MSVYNLQKIYNIFQPAFTGISLFTLNLNTCCPKLYHIRLQNEGFMSPWGNNSNLFNYQGLEEAQLLEATLRLILICLWSTIEVIVYMRGIGQLTL